jgi:uncharacterized protein
VATSRVAASCIASTFKVANALKVRPRIIPPMKFEPETLEGANHITRHETQSIWVGPVRHDASVLVPWVGAVQPWHAATLEELGAPHFERLLGLAPELVIFGSGSRLRFVSPKLMQSLMAQRIGVETMDTAAACRTFNVLVSEGRNVVAALMLGPAA